MKYIQRIFIVPILLISCLPSRHLVEQNSDSQVLTILPETVSVRQRGNNPYEYIIGHQFANGIMRSKYSNDSLLAEFVIENGQIQDLQYFDSTGQLMYHAVFRSYGGAQETTIHGKMNQVLVRMKYPNSIGNSFTVNYPSGKRMLSGGMKNQEQSGLWVVKNPTGGNMIKRQFLQSSLPSARFYNSVGEEHLVVSGYSQIIDRYDSSLKELDGLIMYNNKKYTGYLKDYKVDPDNLYMLTYVTEGVETRYIQKVNAGSKEFGAFFPIQNYGYIESSTPMGLPRNVELLLKDTTYSVELDWEGSYITKYGVSINNIRIGSWFTLDRNGLIQRWEYYEDGEQVQSLQLNWKGEIL